MGLKIKQYYNASVQVYDAASLEILSVILVTMFQKRHYKTFPKLEKNAGKAEERLKIPKIFQFRKEVTKWRYDRDLQNYAEGGRN